MIRYLNFIPRGLWASELQANQSYPIPWAIPIWRCTWSILWGTVAIGVLHHMIQNEPTLLEKTLVYEYSMFEEFLDTLKTFHSHQTWQSMTTQCKELWVTLKVVFINNLPRSKSEETGLPSPRRKVIEMWLTSKGIVSKILPDPVLKHSTVNQSPGSWVP